MPDDLDRALVHALHLDGRAQFSRIAAVLGVSTQTVSRRYQRLRVEAALRVVGSPHPLRAGASAWLVRLTAEPHNAVDLAYALARRDDARWVQLMSGGTEILGAISIPAQQENALLLHDIPRTAGITSVSAHRVLHIYQQGSAWGRGGDSVLTEQQQGRLRWSAPPGCAGRELIEADRPLLAALHRDGRASHAALAAATGWSAATVARRLDQLRAGGGLHINVEVDHQRFGAATRTMLWMAVRPGRLERVAAILSGHEELAFLAATTGQANLIASAMTSDAADLHRYLTGKLGAVPSIQSLETSPVLRTIKAFGPVAARPR